ncbi:MAG: NAD(P) transhydrogenase subunit alpha [Devosiaceae bacterium]|nr:NAD(P) transhydrogenase subunit alpha [Devosiaceae bacterium MH13]
MSDSLNAAVEAAQEAAARAAEAAAEAGRIAEELAAGTLETGAADALAAAASGASGGAIDPFIFRLSIFVLAIFVGYYVVWSVTPALHTPLMSVTNAISSVIVVGALLAVGVELASADGAGLARGFGFVALILASVNIFGGFLVTQRMLGMYKKKQR